MKKGNAMLKGLALTPPEIGRIAIGRVVERNGKRLPQKDDEFILATQLQTPAPNGALHRRMPK